MLIIGDHPLSGDLKAGCCRSAILDPWIPPTDSEWAERHTQELRRRWSAPERSAHRYWSVLTDHEASGEARTCYPRWDSWIDSKDVEPRWTRNAPPNVANRARQSWRVPPSDRRRIGEWMSGPVRGSASAHQSLGSSHCCHKGISEQVRGINSPDRDPSCPDRPRLDQPWSIALRSATYEERSLELLASAPESSVTLIS